MATLEPDGREGDGLVRPECVLAHDSGALLVPCWAGSGGVDLLRDGRSHRLLASADRPLFDETLRANGIALDASGRLLLAHLGESRGAIVALHPDGRTEIVCDSVDGAPMPPANFVVADRAGRLWITVSTRIVPRADDYRKGARTGFIALLEPGERDARIVADGLGYTNECVVDETRARLYVNETFARRTTTFDLAADGSLSGRRTLHTFGEGCYPDGLALDVEGGLWITSIVSNRVLRLTPDGRVATLLEDADPAHVERVEDAWRSDRLGREHLDNAAGERLRNVSNLAFGGPDMKSVWLGNLLGDALPRYRSTVAGERMLHADAPFDAFARLLDDEARA